jgi:hypothetical protein
MGCGCAVLLGAVSPAPAQSERPDFRLVPDRLNEYLLDDRLSGAATNSLSTGTAISAVRRRTVTSAVPARQTAAAIRYGTFRRATGRTDLEQKRIRAVAIGRN